MKTALIILDGWGHGNPDEHNAIHVAETPCVDDMNAGCLMPPCGPTASMWGFLKAKWATAKSGT